MVDVCLLYRQAGLADGFYDDIKSLALPLEEGDEGQTSFIMDSDVGERKLKKRHKV